MEIRFFHFLRICWDVFVTVFVSRLLQAVSVSRISLRSNFKVFSQGFTELVLNIKTIPSFSVLLTGKKEISLYTYFCMLVPQFLLDKKIIEVNLWIKGHVPFTLKKKSLNCTPGKSWVVIYSTPRVYCATSYLCQH